MLRVARSVWANSTWEARQHLWARFNEFCSRWSLDPAKHFDYCVAVFVESTRATTLPASRLKYSLDLTAIGSRLGHDLTLTRLYQAGLRATGALVPTEQASPVTIEQLRHLAARATLQRQGQRLYAALFLLWKSASRWDDISRLVRRQIVKSGPDEIIINWRDNTKTTRADPFRPDSQTAIRHDPRIPQEVLTALDQLEPTEPIFAHTTQWFEAWLKQELPQAGITAHSFKTAAISIVARAAADKTIPLRLIPLLAKHKTATQDLPTTTLRYIQDITLKADLLETGSATILLPW